MKMANRVISFLLTLALLAGLPIQWSVVARAEEVSTATVYDLMTDDMVDPVGLDNPAPVFSWKMRSDTVGQKQTAYQLTVKNGDKTVWDSGKVESDISVGIVYGGEALLSSTTYSWSVKVWDKDGKLATSGTATFEMGLMEKDAFEDTHFISFQEAIPDSPSVYTIDFDFEITGRVLGFIFGAKNDEDFLMWQFSSQWGQLRPHKALSVISGQEVNICQTAENEALRILQGNGDKTEASYTANKGIIYHARIDVDGKVIKTYLGTSADNLVLISNYTHDSVVYLRRMGFRQAGGESAKVDNLIVTDGDGKVYYENRFESADTNDIASSLAALNNGWLEVKSGAQIVLQQAGTDITSYNIDWDFEIYGRAASLLFSAKDTSNFMMWQFNGREGSFKPHVCTNGSWASRTVKIAEQSDAAFHILKGPGDKSAAADTVNRGTTYHARAEVRGATVKTYLGTSADNLTLIDTHTYSAMLPLGKLGFRQGDSVEKSYYDNIIVTDIKGNKVYENKFDSAAGNDLVGECRTIVEGRLFAERLGSTTTVSLQQDPETKPAPGAKSVPAYRKSITVKDGLVSAKLYTAGLGVYESYINGQRVGRKLADGSVQYHELKPGFTQRNKRQFYSTFDVTWMLTKGENVLGGVVTGGWWTGVGALFKGVETAYLAKLILTYEDGSQEIITTDTTWKAEKYGAFQTGTGIYAGERYDATIDQGWMLPGYDDSTWPNVRINTEFNGTLESWDGVPVILRDDLERKPQTMTVYKGSTGAVADEKYGDVTVLRSYSDGDTIALAAGETLLVNFGQNFAGREYIEIEGAKGTVVTIEHGEWLNEPGGVIARGNDGPGGSLFETSNRSITANTIYTMSGNGVEKYYPTQSFYGFQYIEITAKADITIHKLRGQVVTSVQSETASMVTSDADVNKLLSNINWGMYSNYLSIPTDCPQRNERQGWTGDAQVFSQAGTYLTYSKSFLTNYLQVLRDAQRESDGGYPDIAPFVHVYADTTYGEVGWGDAGIVIPWYLYMMYGDTAPIKEHWASMRKYMDVFMESTDGLGSALGAKDHLNLENSSKQPVGDLLAIAYFAWDALMMVDMAEALGETEAAAHYRTIYEREKKIFQDLYVAEDGSLLRWEQTALLYALYLDLLPNQQSVDAVTQQLLNSISQYGDIMMTGFLGTSIINNTLTKIGRSDVAYTLLLQHDYPSWLYSVDQGATTMWERWNAYTEADGFGPASMTSFNHYAYGAVAGWMYKTMAGIGFDEEKPGFKNIVLAPAFDSRMPSIVSSYDSAYGPISTSTSISGGTTTYKASIPANTTAVAKIPVAEGQTLTVNGKTLSALTLDTDGIRYLKTANGMAEFEAVAGSFTFVLKDAAAQETTTVDWSNHYCQHCKKNVAWTPFSTVFKATTGASTTDTTMVDGGHYYLDKDHAVTYRINPLRGCLHLNGKTLSNSVEGRNVSILTGGTLSIMDHPENKGLITAKGKNVTRGAVLSGVNAAVLNIYGGTLKPADGYKTGVGGVLFGDKSVKINMYGGVVSGGHVNPISQHASDNTTGAGCGGSVYLNEGAVFTMYGGIVEGGYVDGTCGGNIYINSYAYSYGGKDYTGGASFVMYGGTLRDGSAKLGGNIYAQGNAKVTIHGGTIEGGKATDGGNIYMASGTTLTIDEDKADTLITLGKAEKGGNISLVGATATMDAGTVSYGYATATTGYGGGNLLLDANSTFTLNQDEGKESIISYGRSDLKNYNSSIHSYGTLNIKNGKVIRGNSNGSGSNICVHKGTTTISGGYVGQTVVGANVLVTNGGKLVVQGGTLDGNMLSNEQRRNITIWDNGIVNISGGTFLGDYSGNGGCVMADKGATITISGGTFSGSASSDVAVALTQADNVSKGTTLNISGGSIASLYVADNNTTFDPTVTVSGKPVIDKLVRGGDTKPVIGFALTDGASVTFHDEVAGEVFGSGSSTDHISSNNHLTAALDGTSLKWEKTRYTVTFLNDDDSEISSKAYAYGDTIQVPADPTKAPDNTYTYTFNGWDKAVEATCTGNATYKATYDRAYIDYTVKFLNEDGTPISEKTYHYGDQIEVPADPTKAADNTYTYTFNGWDKAVDATCKGNATYQATFKETYIDYTVKFLNEDGTPISEKTYHYGDEITVPADPTKAADNTYTYAFTGWDMEVETTCKGNATYTATYKGTYIDYTVKFLNEDGTPISEKAYHYGDTIEIPADPTKAADNTFTYAFNGWSPKVSATCAGNATYQATFAKTNISYTVKFLNEDGTPISEKAYHYGDTIEIPADPTKAADSTFTYAFNGWSPKVSATCAGNATYQATFAKTNISYTVKFLNEDGTPISEKTYHYGDQIEIPADPTKAADNTFTYAFNGWDKAVEATCKGNATYQATFKETYIDYTVKFLNEDGTPISEKTYHYGDTVEVPADPTRESFRFDGWEPAVAQTVTADATYTAKWTRLTTPVIPGDSVSYVVEHYKAGTDGKYPAAPTETQRLQGKIGDTVTAEAKAYAGFCLNSQSSVTSGKLVAIANNSDILVLKLYYDADANGDKIPDRFQKKVTFRITNGTWSDGTDKPVTVWLTLTRDGKWDESGAAALTVPTGMKPAEGCEDGKWNVQLPETVTGSEALELTFSFTKPVPQPSTPSTGDEAPIGTYVLLLAASLLAAAAVLMVMKKKSAR